MPRTDATGKWCAPVTLRRNITAGSLIQTCMSVFTARCQPPCVQIDSSEPAARMGTPVGPVVTPNPARARNSPADSYGSERPVEIRRQTREGQLNWLKKQGRLEFLRLRSIAELQSCWPTISEQYDRRIANVFGCDPICGEFFFECLRRDPTLVQGFALLLNGTIIAAIIGVRCRDCLVLAVSTFDQSSGAQSPSRLLVPMIADAIWEDGYRYFDLSLFAIGRSPWRRERRP